MSAWYVPQPWLLCLLVAALPVLVTKALPPLARVIGHGMTSSAAPIATVLVLPEFWLTSALRAQGLRVPAAVHAYDRVVEVTFHGLRRAGTWTGRVLGHARRLRPAHVLAPVLLLLVLWYAEPQMAMSPARAQLVSAKCQLLRASALLTPLDGWSSKDAVCPVAPPALPVTGALPPGSPYGRFDTASMANGSLTLIGWAVDPDVETGRVEVRAYVDAGSAGAAAVAAETGQPRPDVAGTLGLPADTGYALRVTVSDTAQEVCIYAMNSGSGSNSVLGCKALRAGR